MITRHANWDYAECVLGGILPGSTAFDPDRIVGIPFEGWQPFDLEERDLGIIEEDLLSYCTGFVGPLIVVNDRSFDTDQGPYFVNSQNLVSFVKTFGDKTGGSYFTCPSVFIVSPMTGVVVIVQDDGYIAITQGHPAIAISLGRSFLR